MHNLTFKIIQLGLMLLLAACGGGDGVQPAVSQLQASTLRYGQTAVIQVAGKYLRNDMLAETSGCSGPAFRADSVPDLAVLTCKVTAAGPLTVSIRSASGALLFTQTLSVPLPKVLFVTSMGSFELELNPAVVPVTVDNFLGYVSRSFYSNTLFHRVVAGFVVQGGGFTAGLVEKEPKSAPIVLESNRGLSNTRSTVAMARTADPSSATSQFFVNVVDNVALDYQNADNPGYAVFGKVVSGMDVLDAIAAVPTATVGVFQTVPTTDVTINLALQVR